MEVKNPIQATATQGRKELISMHTKDKAQAAKAYIEMKYSKLKKEEKEKKENWALLEEKMDNLNLNNTERELIKHEILHKESEKLRKKRQKISAKNFDPLAIIGRGAFGEVRLCRDKGSNEILAIKKMKKNEMVYKNQVGHVRAERDILASANNPWIVELKYSFQDLKYLYLVMEYLAGGDLMTLLMKKDILSEEEGKFYIAEIILAVDSVHKMNYIHRDLKPDNILIDSKGHIKLSDFGLCKHTEIKPKIDLGKKTEDHFPNPNGIYLDKLEKNTAASKFKRNRQLAYSTVGTPDYIAPEVFGQNGYSETVDWWSIGVILFEMLVGYPPFFSEEPSTTCQKILHWRKTFSIPPEANLSPAAADIIRKLVTDSNERLGVNGVEEIKAHPFFYGIDWKRIRDKKAPYIPELKSEIDTSNFDKFDEEEPWVIEANIAKKNRKQDINFIGYTFKRDVETERSSLIAALQNLEQTKQSIQRIQQQERRSVSPVRPAAGNLPPQQKAESFSMTSRDSFIKPETPSNFSQILKTNTPGLNNLLKNEQQSQPANTGGILSGPQNLIKNFLASLGPATVSSKPLESCPPTKPTSKYSAGNASNTTANNSTNLLSNTNSPMLLSTNATPKGNTNPIGTGVLQTPTNTSSKKPNFFQEYVMANQAGVKKPDMMKKRDDVSLNTPLANNTKISNMPASQMNQVGSSKIVSSKLDKNTTSGIEKDAKDRSLFVLQRPQQVNSSGKENAGAYNGNIPNFMSYTQQMKNNNFFNEDEKRDGQGKSLGIPKGMEGASQSQFYSKILSQTGASNNMKLSAGSNASAKFVQTPMNTIVQSHLLGKK